MSLAAEVRQVRVGVGIGDADVDYPAHAGGFGGLEHDLGLLDALLVGSFPVIDADPVGVEQGVGSGQRFLQQVGTVEIERVQRHLFSERVVPVGVSGDRLDLVFLLQ